MDFLAWEHGSQLTQALIHWGLNKMSTIALNMISNAFLEWIELSFGNYTKACSLSCVYMGRDCGATAAPQNRNIGIQQERLHGDTLLAADARLLRARAAF